jgi:hypothetical protein
MNFLILFDDTAFSFLSLNSRKSLIAEFCAPRGRAPDEQNHKTYLNLRIGATSADKFLLLGKNSGRADKVVSFRTIPYVQACIQLAVTLQVQCPSKFIPCL